MKINKKPALVIYDFDGVMTDNLVTVDENGTESVTVNRGDGYGIRMIKDELKIPQVIISTEENKVVAKRAEKLKIPVLHGVTEKSETVRLYCEQHKIPLESVLFVGNDLNDLGAMKICGSTACPCDAEPEILQFADVVIPVKGGRGVARYLYRLLARTQL